MLQLFTPQSKVQKDRKLMHDTDSRIAKYSRRGLVLNFIVFALCLYFGDFFTSNQGLAIVLVTGLLLITLLRSYFLFRFENHYARAPNRWRNQYFFVSFLGAAWWSFILVSLTWVVGMRDETLIMWLYSVVFYSSVANVFAPYQRFLSLYLCIGQIPAAITAILLGTVDGYLYGAIMLMFYYILSHQGRITAKSYWQRLEANFALRERAKGLEDEKRHSQVAIELKNEFLSNLGHEFRTSLNDILGSLSLLEGSELSDNQRELLRLANKSAERQLDLVNNVADYAKISNRKLVLDQVIFNLRRNLEILVEDLAAEAEQQGVELNYDFDSDMPARVRGDATRINQILSNLLSHAIKFSKNGRVAMRGNYHKNSSSLGELTITIDDLDANGETLNDHQVLDNKEPVSLNLSICRALAECMGGNIQIARAEQGNEQILIKLKLEAAGKQTQHLQANPKLQDKRVLLVNPPRPTAQALSSELTEWGLHVTRCQLEDTIDTLNKAATQAEPFDLCLIFSPPHEGGLLELSKQIMQDPALQHTGQILVTSVKERSSAEAQMHTQSFESVRILSKPLARHHLYDALNSLLLDIHPERSSNNETSLQFGSGQKVLLVDDHRVSQMVTNGMLKKLGYTAEIANNGVEAIERWKQGGFELILMDCQMPEMDGYCATREIRAEEAANTEQDSHIPIIAMTAHAAEGEQARCLAAGMDDYLPKPVRLGELQLRLKRWLGGNRHA